MASQLEFENMFLPNMWRSLGMLSYGVPCYSGWQGRLLHLDDDEGNLLHPNHRHAQVPVVPLPNLQAKKLRFKTHQQRSHQRGIFPNLPTTKKFPSRLPTKKSLLEPNKDWSPLKIPQILRGWLRMNVSFGELSTARSIQYQNLSFKQSWSFERACLDMWVQISNDCL